MLSDRHILDLWERAAAVSAPRRPLLLASEVAALEVADLPAGERERLILELRARWFGPELLLLRRCAACGELVELPLDLRGLLAAPAAAERVSVAWGDRCWVVRTPTSADLLAAQTGVELLERLAEAGAPIGEPGFAEAASAAVAEADLLAEIIVDVRCGSCGHLWAELFDAGSYVWAELDGAARRVVQDVSTLARAHGWSETEILDMSDRRRRLYLEEVGA